MKVGEVSDKAVVVADRGTDLVQAARMMRDFHVGTLVAIEHDGDLIRPVGIVTDRDIVVGAVAAGTTPDTSTVADVMSPEIQTVREDDDLLDTLGRMRDLGVRRLPVIDGAGGLVGILAVDDVLEVLAESIGSVPQLIRREQSNELQRCS